MKKAFRSICILTAAVFALTLIALASGCSRKAPEADGSGVTRSNVFAEAMPEYTGDPADLPKVVDLADILSDEEEKELSDRIAAIVSKYNTDMVIVTGNTTNGLGKAVYAADFYDFGGYGCGAEKEGYCMFFCPSGEERGGWCCATGSASRGRYTEQIANIVDDQVYPYLERGEYFNGFSEWLDCMENLLYSGMPVLPVWYPGPNEAYTRTRDASAPRIFDEAGILDDSQEAALLAKAAEISNKYGIDVVVHTSNTTYGLDPDGYGEALYTRRGYGLNEGYDGVLLTLYSNGRDSNIQAFGSASQKLSSKNISRLLAGVEGPAEEGNFNKAANRWLDYLGTTLKTGRTPRTPLVWTIRAIASAITSFLASAFGMSTAKASMKTVRTAYQANDHLVSDSFRMRTPENNDTFIRSDVSRVFSPLARETGKEGGSHGSSTYSGSYTGSSGTTHTGSGRDF
ncbi:MAG: TPM domain-containing protein [Clostridia bacterium]|nr:TPM domain-containing protein [Clostridia bacterium]